MKNSTRHESWKWHGGEVSLIERHPRVNFFRDSYWQDIWKRNMKSSIRTCEPEFITKLWPLEVGTLNFGRRTLKGIHVKTAALKRKYWLETTMPIKIYCHQHKIVWHSSFQKQFFGFFSLKRAHFVKLNSLLSKCSLWLTKSKATSKPV